MTNANVEKRKIKKKTAKNTNHTLKLTIAKKIKQASRDKRVFTKTILTYGKAVQ